MRLYQFSSTSGANYYRISVETGTWRQLAHAATPTTLFPGDTTRPLLPTAVDTYGNYIGYQFATVGRVLVVMRMFRSDRPVTADDLLPIVQSQSHQLATAIS